MVKDSRRPRYDADLARIVADQFPSDAIDHEVVWQQLSAIFCDWFRAACVTIVVRHPSGALCYSAHENSAQAQHRLAKTVVERALKATLRAAKKRQTAEFCAFPLAFKRKSFGGVLIERDRPLDDREVALVDSCALFLGTRLQEEEARQQTRRLEELAYTDGLTGIANRRKFDETLASEWKRLQRMKQALTIIMIDVDYFKVFNDLYGHQLGDTCLQRVAQALTSCSGRSGDLIARYGGEEFVALLPATDLAGGIALAEAFRKAMKEAAVAHAGSSLGVVTLSIGVATATPSRQTMGELLLRDADAALYQAKESGRNRVYAEAYVSDGPEVKRFERPKLSNLPKPMTDMVGRTEEIARVCDGIRAHSLTSIIGVGGSGKTRVAICAASEMLDTFEDGAWFVDFSTITDGAFVALKVASAFGLTLNTEDDGASALVALLRRKHILLVLDNCEHLRDSIGGLCNLLLQECPSLRILATSRESIGALHEEVYHLPLLSIPVDPRVTAEAAEKFDGIRLFVERARSLKPSFELIDQNVGDIVRICRIVDGIALGIELLAPRLAVVSAAQLADRIEDDLGAVSSGRRAAIPRHQTMTALIDWSYASLTEREQSLFRRLAAFSAGWTLENASRVCSWGDIDAFDLFDLHAELVDRSLITEMRVGEHVRYRFLEPVRQFARKALADSTDERETIGKHAALYCDLAKESDRVFLSTSSMEWFANIEREIDNYRVCIRWSLLERNAIVLGAATAAALSWYFYYSAPSEGIRYIRQALQEVEVSENPAVEARLWLALTPLYALPKEEKRRAGERAVALYRVVDDREKLSHALRLLGLTLAWYYPDQQLAAATLMDEAALIARERNDYVGGALILQAQSQLVDPSDANRRQAMLYQAYDLLKEYGNERQISVALTDLSEIAFAQGDTPKAFAYGQEAVATAKSSGSRNTMICAAINLAHYAVAMGQWDCAWEHASHAITMAEESQAHEMLTFSINAVASALARDGSIEAAATLFGFCNARFGRLHAPRHTDMCEDITYRESLDILKSVLDPAALDQLFAEGATLSEDGAIALVEQQHALRTFLEAPTA